MAEGSPVFRLIGPRGAEGPWRALPGHLIYRPPWDGTVTRVPLLRIRFPLLSHVICCGFTEV